MPQLCCIIWMKRESCFTCLNSNTCKIMAGPKSVVFLLCSGEWVHENQGMLTKPGKVQSRNGPKMPLSLGPSNSNIVIFVVFFPPTIWSQQSSKTMIRTGKYTCLLLTSGCLLGNSLFVIHFERWVAFFLCLKEISPTPRRADSLLAVTGSMKTGLDTLLHSREI